MGLAMHTIYYILLTTIIKKEKDNRWTAQCRELGTATFGHSFEEAKEAIEEAISLHLNTLEEVGERERFFNEHGIKMISTKPKKSVRINMPVDSNTFVNSYLQPVNL